MPDPIQQSSFQVRPLHRCSVCRFQTTDFSIANAHRETTGHVVREQGVGARIADAIQHRIDSGAGIPECYPEATGLLVALKIMREMA